MNLEELSQLAIKMLNISAFVYLLSALAFFFALARSSKSLWPNRCAQAFAWGAFLLHTTALGFRWYIGGFDRPPWTNLYESLIAFAWAASFLQIVAQTKWKFSNIGVIVMPIVFLLMGMAVMTPNKSVEPLIPALQSYWLQIHVFFGIVAYGAFTVAACLAFLHLMRNGYSYTKIGLSLALMSLLNLGLMGGEEFFKTGQVHLAKTVEITLEDGSKKRVKDQFRQYEGGPMIIRTEKSTPLNIPFYLSFLFFFLSAVFMGAQSFKLRGQKELNDPTASEAASHSMDISKSSKTFFVLGVFSLSSFLALFFWVTKTVEHFSLQSNPYLFMLLVTTVFLNAFYLVASINYENFLEKLPSASRIAELSYKNILFAFPFQSLLLITGAIWAYYAWGRSWGWDPKETWALITWIVYLIYLHGKLLLNWKSNLLSLIAILGFVVLVFAFLGVNLVLSGLHSYGSA